MPSRTPLYDWHVANGGRIVDFAGWEMPIQYTTIIEEHEAVRRSAGIFDVSHMGRLSFGGPESINLIQKVYTNNAATMADYQVRYGLVCNPQGGIRDDVLVYRWPFGYAMVVNASNRDKIVTWLQLQNTTRSVDIRDQTVDTSMIALQGPKAIAMTDGLTGMDLGQLRYYHAAATLYKEKPCLVSRTGYTGEDGVEFMVSAALATTLWEELIERGAKPCGLGARDTLRLEAAMPLYGHELTEQIDPFQAKLAWAVKLDKGEFVGRSALTRRRTDSSLRQRIGLEIEGKRIAREGSVVMHSNRAIGQISSGTFAPTLGKVIAMAYVDQEFTQVGQLLEIDIRGKVAPARVAPLPFYQRAKA